LIGFFLPGSLSASGGAKRKRAADGWLLIVTNVGLEAQRQGTSFLAPAKSFEEKNLWWTRLRMEMESTLHSSK
jgi:hypothetical protein